MIMLSRIYFSYICQTWTVVGPLTYHETLIRKRPYIKTCFKPNSSCIFNIFDFSYYNVIFHVNFAVLFYRVVVCFKNNIQSFALRIIIITWHISLLVNFSTVHAELDGVNNREQFDAILGSILNNALTAEYPDAASKRSGRRDYFFHKLLVNL